MCDSNIRADPSDQIVAAADAFNTCATYGQAKPLTGTGADIVTMLNSCGTYTCAIITPVSYRPFVIPRRRLMVAVYLGWIYVGLWEQGQYRNIRRQHNVLCDK